MKHIFLSAALMLGIGSAQTAPAPFEVTSIRPNHTGTERTGISYQPGRLVADNVSLRRLIEYAYGVKDFQISGGPGWIDSEKFDITAKEEAAVAEARQKLPWKQYTEQLRLMVQLLLAERFHLKVIRQPKETSILALVTAKGGPKLERSALNSYAADFRGRRGQLLGKGVSLAQLADILSWMEEVGVRKVVDQTGLEGTFDLTLRWSFERGPVAGAPPETVQPDAPSIFNAVQEQLGLKLEPIKGPVDFLVVDHVEPPSEN